MPRTPHANSSWSRLDTWAALAITALALVARLIYLAQARSNPLADKIIMDARSYWEWSDRLAQGEWLGTQVFYQAPLYPYFLGMLKSLFGADLSTVKYVQALLGAAACGFMFLASRLWMHAAGLEAARARRIGLIAGAILALYPPAIFLDSLIQKANLGVLWMTLLLWLLARVWLRPSAARALGLGVVMALLMLTREETILLVPVVALVTLVGARRFARTPEPPVASQASPRGVARPLVLSLLALVAGLAVILAPVAWRNHKVGGEWVLTTSQAGPNFYIGNNATATGVYAPLRAGRSNTPFERRDAFEIASEVSKRQLTPTEVSRFWTQKALDFISLQPGKWLRLMGRKAVLLVNHYEVPDSEDQYYFEQNSSLLRVLSFIGHMGVLVPLAGFGLVLSWRYRRELWPLYLVALTLSGAVILFYVFARYRFPVVPALLPFVALALHEGLVLLRRRELRPLAAPALVAIALAVPANWKLYDRRVELAGTVSNAGAAMSESGDDERAIQLFQQALIIRPDLPDTLANMALSQARLGKPAEAELTMRKAVAMRPDDPRHNFRLGTILVELNRVPESVPFLKKAHELAPQDVDARVNYTTVLTILHRHAELVALLRDSARRDPTDLSTAANLAWVLATSPDDKVRNPREAADIVRAAIAKAPGPSADLNDIHAAALAGLGDFPGAIAASQQAVQLADRPASGLTPEAVAAFKARLELYKSGKPFIDR